MMAINHAPMHCRSAVAQRPRRAVLTVRMAATPPKGPLGRWAAPAQKGIRRPRTLSSPPPPEDQWAAPGFDPLGLGKNGASNSVAAQAGRNPLIRSTDESLGGGFFKGPVGKMFLILSLVVVSRVGVYVRLPGVDVDAFAQSMQSGGLLQYVDALSGGSISKVGIFSLGIVPYINASIILQLLATTYPSLKKLQREEGKAGKDKYEQYQKYLALVFALAQSIGQLTYIRPFVTEFSPVWFAEGVFLLTGGAMALVYIAETISKLKLGNGTSILIFASIASSVPSSIGAAIQQSAESDSIGTANLVTYAIAFTLTTLGIVYVQEAERRIPINYASRFKAGSLAQQSYLPFKVNAAGVMPVIFATTLMSLPSGVARFTDLEFMENLAGLLYPSSPVYLPTYVALIVFFNYYYTFLQLDPKDVSDQLRKQGASIPNVRPGRSTAEYITGILSRMSVLGSVFLGVLAAAPTGVEAITHLTAFRGFAGTSVLIMVGVAQDTARKFRAEKAMQKYNDVGQSYDNL
eukprot:jgi/Tetstr1/466687/TSEL_001002.t1